MPKLILLLSFITLAAKFLPAQTASEYYDKASAYYDSKQLTNALIDINQALKLEPMNELYLLFRGNILFEMNRFEQSYQTYTTLITINPKNAIAYNQRGLLFSKFRSSTEAVADFSTALSFERSDSVRLSLFLNRGSAYLSIRAFDSAYSDFLNAYKYDSLNLGVLNNLAIVSDEIGKGDMTLYYLEKVVSIDSTFLGGYVNIGFKYLGMGRYEEAIRYLDKAIALEPTSGVPYSNRAFGYYKLGKLDKAMQDINKSIELYPGNSYAYKNRALIYFAMKLDVKACADLDEALRLGFTKEYGNEVKELKEKYCQPHAFLYLTEKSYARLQKP